MLAHSESLDRLLAELNTTAQGLTHAEAGERLRRFGPNQLPTPPPTHVFRLFIRQFFNPLIYILLVVGLISILIGHHSDAVFILTILGINAIIGTVQESSAERGAMALKQVVSARIGVLRDGKPVEIDTVQLVVGDVLLLESGRKLPADARLLSAQGLEIDESLLTGESIAAFKDPAAPVAQHAVVGDRRNMAFAGTLVTRGRAQAVVVATGLATELGKIADSVLHGESAKTPLIQRMEQFTRKLAIIFSVAVVLVGGVLIAQGQPWIEVFFLAVALGVSAIPEGLPVALTVALAIASRRMAKRNVIVRKLASVEALGSCTFIGTDKTGTLTVNEMSVRRAYLPTGQMIDLGSLPGHSDSEALRELALASALCNEAVRSEKHTTGFRGDSVDVALLAFAEKSGLDPASLLGRFVSVGEIPFESELQFAATAHQESAREGETSVRYSAKGALEKILLMCRASTERRSEIEAEASRLATQGYRVLAVAGAVRPSFRSSAVAARALAVDDLSELEFLGLLGMIDPPRPEALEAIRASHRAGVDVAMITGDHPVTALAIARELEIAQSDDQVTTGVVLKKASASSEASFDQSVMRARVFARVEPNQKLQIVQSLIRQGHFVAVTGDGANDAPALKAANVGVAMGKSGTDVAKETADLIITDDRFSSIIAGIEEGRVAYANVRKVIYLLISTGVAEVFLFVLSILAGYPIPLTAVQLLWLNLVTNGIQDVALAFEPKEGDELTRPPRDPQEPVFDRLMIERVVISALVMGGVSFYEYHRLIGSGMDHATIQNHLLLLMVLFENIMIGNARSETKYGLTISPFRNPFLLIGTAAAQGIHIAAMHFEPLSSVLGTKPVAFRDWLEYLGVAVSLFVAIELHKVYRRWLKGSS
jgi:Ca2+-transporting ATPase